MEIDFCNLLVQAGLMQKEFTLQDETPTGHFERVSLTVWIQDFDSRTATNDAARAAGISLLERALEALRRA